MYSKDSCNSTVRKDCRFSNLFIKIFCFAIPESTCFEINKLLNQSLVLGEDSFKNTSIKNEPLVNVGSNYVFNFYVLTSDAFP